MSELELGNEIVALDFEKQPEVVYQVLYNSIANECRMEEWTQDQIDNPKESGYAINYGLYEEMGCVYSIEEVERLIKRLTNQSNGIVY